MGENRDCWMVNPTANTEDDLELFTFLGKLMGVAIRSKMSLNLTLAPITWKKLLKSTLSLYDIKGFDEPCY